MSNRSNLKPSRKVVLYYREIDWSNLQHHQLALRNNHRLLTNIDQLPEKLKFLTLLPASHMSNALVMFSRCGANQLLRGRVFTLERLPQQRLANQTKINPDLRRVPFRDRHLINIEVLTCWAIRMGLERVPAGVGSIIIGRWSDFIFLFLSITIEKRKISIHNS